MSAQIPDILLERHRLKELPQIEADRLTDLCRQDPELRERLAALDRSDEELRQSGCTDRIAARVEQRGRAGERTPRRSAWFWAIPVAAAAVTVPIAIVVVAPPPALVTRPGVASTNTPAEDRIKGLRPTLAVYRRTANGSETLADGAVARRGDLVRVGYHAAGKSFGVILSIDGRGAITVHLPPAGDYAVPLARDGTVLLDQAYELDDAPQWERFYFITGDTAFPVAPVVAAARQGATTERAAATSIILPRGLEQAIFSLQKEARP